MVVIYICKMCFTKSAKRCTGSGLANFAGDLLALGRRQRRRRRRGRRVISDDRLASALSASTPLPLSLPSSVLQI